MNESIKILLLQVISNKGAVENIISKGYTYSQLANLIKELIRDELVYVKDGSLTVSDSGFKELMILNKKFERYNSETWISPQYEYRVDGLSKFDIFLPRK